MAGSSQSQQADGPEMTAALVITLMLLELTKQTPQRPHLHLLCCLHKRHGRCDLSMHLRISPGINFSSSSQTAKLLLALMHLKSNFFSLDAANARFANL